MAKPKWKLYCPTAKRDLRGFVPAHVLKHLSEEICAKYQYTLRKKYERKWSLSATQCLGTNAKKLAVFECDRLQDQVAPAEGGSNAGAGYVQLLQKEKTSLSAADHAGLVNVLKDKLQSLAGQPSGSLESLPKKVKRRVTVLQELQVEHDELEAKFHEERAALEAKYLKLYEPLYVKRSEIVNGVVEVEAAKDEAPEAESPRKRARRKITDRDEGALKYITDIKCSPLEDPLLNKGFKLDFYFDTNPYLKNTVLSKTYHMIDDDEPILEKAVGTEIDWYPQKNITQKVMKKKPKKRAKNAKPVTKIEQCDSFFNFFSPPQVPEDDDIDQETAEKLQDLMEQDYDVGSTIRDKIIPHAVSWFTGEALQGEDYEDDDDEEGDDDDEDEGEDEDEDEDDEEEVQGRKRGGPAAKGGAHKASGG